MRCNSVMGRVGRGDVHDEGASGDVDPTKGGLAAPRSTTLVRRG